MNKKEKTLKVENNIWDASKYWNDLLIKEFAKETDRGAVILAATLLDVGLDTLLRSFLLTISTSDDELFDGGNAPLGNFSAKINLAFRLGLISDKYASDLHIIRKIRNEFAHNIHGCDFEHSSVKQRVLTLVKSFVHAKIISSLEYSPFLNGTRWEFLMIATWLLQCLNKKIERTESIKPCYTEWWYQGDIAKHLEKKVLSKKQNKNSDKRRIK